VIDIYNSVMVGDPNVAAADPNKAQIAGPISPTASGAGSHLKNCLVANDSSLVSNNTTLRANDPLLGPLLAVDGSKPWTASRSPLQGSPVLDAAGPLPSGLQPFSSVDQRGNTRVVGGKADIGSVEQRECFVLCVVVEMKLVEYELGG